ncbi:YwdI family protein [Alkalihalobacillus sp. AL-G]|uniref:YwdI family protein n=1 Tax=Alkalihalobacillus sp. AL-G TaxID=2926399 RepID=UPI00272BE525|nr:YwdI family protein [Alkalihalobacillus sp. AL-G]WLD93229.1 YwdI family protein [Alkalihalobacillus sp. AL-G]
MSIQSSSIIQKMIDRLEKIKGDVDQSPSSSKVKEELSAVKAYCDLLMDTTSMRSSKLPAAKEKTKPKPHQPVQNWSKKKPDEEDDVNGDSIFDF